MSELRKSLLEKIESNMVICEKCTGLVKPDIVFFGEALPKRFHQLALEVIDGEVREGEINL